MIRFHSLNCPSLNFLPPIMHLVSMPTCTSTSSVVLLMDIWDFIFISVLFPDFELYVYV